ncbi:hypothetical protein PsYK624_113890 [Phanerochaete sordida]|uniref:C3H1-type domain-containing protein n=1 Tax=Phanerochaete sordida TaxID=48140 RepID=A0A9P3GFT0_9APHY|nr:hypothetical protein PsYK624_113890 [Phanerochaete sordida]
MPLVQCMWYNPDGSQRGRGCFRFQAGDCQFVHPSSPEWNRAAPSRNNPPPKFDGASGFRGRRESGDISSRGRDSGWSRAQDRRASAPTWNTSNSGAQDSGAGAGWGTNANASSSSAWNAPRNVSAPSENPFKSAFACASPPREDAPAPSWGASGWGKTVETTSGWGSSITADADTATSSSIWGKSIDEANGWGMTAADNDTSKSSDASGKAADSADGWGATAAEASTPKSSGTWGSTANSGGGGRGNTADGTGGMGTTSNPGGGGDSRGAMSGGGGGGRGATNNSGGGGSGLDTNATITAEQSGWGSLAPAQAAPGSPNGAGSTAVVASNSAVLNVANEPSHDDEPVMGHDWDMGSTAKPDAGSAWSSNEHAEGDAGPSWSSSTSSARVDNPPVESQSSKPAVDADWTMADATPRLQAADKEKWAARDTGKAQEPRGRPESLKARSRTSSRRTSPAGFVRSARPRSVSPELPDGPLKAVKTLSNAVRFYVEWSEARDAYARCKRMRESPQYFRVAPLALDKLKREMRRCREECAEVELRRDEALRSLQLLWAKSGPAGRTEMTEGGEAANPLVAEFKLYAAEINTWLEQMRPLVDSQRPQDASDSTTRDAQASTSAARSRAPVDAQLLGSLQDAMDRIERMDTKVRELEDYQEGLRHGAQDAFDRVETVSGPFPALPLERLLPPEVLQRHEGDIASMQGVLAGLRTEVADQAQRKGATRLDLQRLRTEQEQLRLKLYELEESDNVVRGEMDKMSRGLSEAKAALATLQGQPHAPPAPTPAPPPPAPGPVFTPEQIVAALLPDLRRLSREDVDASLQHLRAGFENAVRDQSDQLCDQVLQLLRPVLATVHLIKKNVGLAGGPLGAGDSLDQTQPFSME